MKLSTSKLSRLFKATTFLSLFWLITLVPASGQRPNVVLIVCDDLNDVIGHMGGHPQGTTPNIDGLAASGASFTHAYSNNPICAPSRSSFVTGIYPHTSGNFAFAKWFDNPILSNSKTLMEYFADAGYQVRGTGKIMHHRVNSQWQEYGNGGNQGPFAWDGEGAVGHPSVPEPFRSIGLLDGSFGSLADVPFGGTGGKGWSSYSWKYEEFVYVDDDNRTLMADEQNANWAATRIRNFADEKTANPDADPLFLAVGFVKPHTPLFAPQKYFDMFPLESIQLPEILEGDIDDTHYRNIFPATIKGSEMFDLFKASYPTLEEGLRYYVQAYLACTAFVDDQIGVVLDAIDQNGLSDDTIVILTSDHGWHLGEKDHLYKNSPWEEAGRVPFIVRAPGVSQAGSRPAAPISLIDLYPTLLDLCGLTADNRKNSGGRPLDGFSVRPFLENPDTREWAGPDTALTMVHAVSDPRNPQPPAAGTDPQYEHYSLRSEHFRYVRYNDGVEELYDHRVDPYEWTNVVDDPAHLDTLWEFRIRLGEFIPALEPEYTPGAWLYTYEVHKFLNAFVQGDWSYSHALDTWVYSDVTDPNWLFVVDPE